MKTHRGGALHFEGGEERDSREDRKLDKRMYRKSILLMFKKSKNMVPQDQLSPPFPWGPCKQKVLPTHSCKSDNVPLYQVSYTGVRCSPGLHKKGTALAKHQNNKRSLRPAVATPALELGICLDTTWLAQSACCH